MTENRSTQAPNDSSAHPQRIRRRATTVSTQARPRVNAARVSPRARRNAERSAGSERTTVQFSHDDVRQNEALGFDAITGNRSQHHQQAQEGSPIDSASKDARSYSRHDPRYTTGTFSRTQPQRRRVAQPQEQASANQPLRHERPANQALQHERPANQALQQESPGGQPVQHRHPANPESWAYMQRPASPAYGADRYRNRKNRRSGGGQAAKRTLIAVAIVAVIAVVGVFGYQNWAAAQPVDVIVNGQKMELQGEERSVQGILDAGRVSVTPGNYVAVDGSLMTQGGGTVCTASINDQATEDLNARLNEGDTVTITDGTDITEPYTDSNVEVLPYSVEIKGTGAVHLYSTDAQNGEKVTRTGNESGKTTEIVTKEAVNRTVQYYNVDSGGDKVIALTFDDGPWDSQTSEVLDILEENGAKATFFTVGECIEGREDVVKRAASAGHQISTHTYDHAEGSGQGVSLILMSDEERKTEVQKGYEAIENVTGTTASTIFRCPGGNFDESVATSLDGIVTAEIGWNVDTNDWRRPGSEVIAQRIEEAGPGEIVLMHDGGGDRSQTIAALREALPVLKEQGYEFVTVQELIERYPYSGDSDEA